MPINTSTYAYGINGSGQIVGTFQDATGGMAFSPHLSPSPSPLVHSLWPPVSSPSVQ
jgi:hypothetical protein